MHHSYWASVPRAPDLQQEKPMQWAAHCKEDPGQPKIKKEIKYILKRASEVASVIKNPPANTRDIRDASLILGSRRSPGGGHSNPLQYSCLENPMDRGAWWATVRRVAKSWTWLKWLSVHIYKEKNDPASSFFTGPQKLFGGIVLIKLIASYS